MVYLVKEMGRASPNRQSCKTCWHAESGRGNNGKRVTMLVFTVHHLNSGMLRKVEGVDLMIFS